jgi:hypothetical protein
MYPLLRKRYELGEVSVVLQERSFLLHYIQNEGFVVPLILCLLLTL